MKFKFGRGLGKTGSHKGSFGSLSADISKVKKTASFEEIATNLAKSLDFKDGEIEFFTIEFNYKERID